MPNQSGSQIFRLFTSRNWLIFTTLIVFAFFISIRLGIWQYERHVSRVDFNNSVTAALAADSQEIDFSRNDYRDWQKVSLAGSFVADSQKLVRRRYLEGQLGFWVVAKFETNSGQVILINRGFAPVNAAANESPRLADPAPGFQEIEGYLQKLEAESLRPSDLPTGQVNAINRVQFEMDENSFPFYLNQINSSDGLKPVTPPELSYGSHLAYSLQWFVFALMIVLGWFLMTKKEITELKKLN